jgi:hypothetical protein
MDFQSGGVRMTQEVAECVGKYFDPQWNDDNCDAAPGNEYCNCNNKGVDVTRNFCSAFITSS